MNILMPNHFPKEEEGNILRLSNQTFIQFYKRRECFKHLVNLEHHLIVVILQGTKVMISAEEDITITKNELLFLEKGAYVASEKILEEGEFVSILFSLEDDFLKQFKTAYNQYLTKGENYLTSKMFKMEASSNLERYIQSLLPYFGNQQKIAPPILRLKIHELLLSLLFSDNQTQFKHYLSSLGQTNNLSFKETIEQSVFKNITIEERAFLSQLSASSFKRKFKEIFNDSPAHWFREQKLKRAKILISKTDKNISEIAFEVGFESPSHFIYLFKKQFGITPKKLKN